MGAVAVGPYVVSGMDAAMQVSTDVFSLDATDGTVHASVVATLDVPRYCSCALFIPAATSSSCSAAATTDMPTPPPPSSWISPPARSAPSTTPEPPITRSAATRSSRRPGTGAIFGGLASSAGFTDQTWRYDPVDRTFTELNTDGPFHRYDAGVHVLDNGDALLVGGMGNSGFASDVWRFDAAAEVWSEIAVTSSVVPAGRRFPWTAVAPDESILLYGYGSDSPMGDSVLRTCGRSSSRRAAGRGSR